MWGKERGGVNLEGGLYGGGRKREGGGEGEVSLTKVSQFESTRKWFITI